jgi:single-strand DNA-binding protein
MITSGLGRLGKDPEMQYTPKGSAQTKFSVAVNAGFGENKSTIWVNLICWGTQAETVNKYLNKGSRIVFSAEVTKVGAYMKKDDTAGVTFDAKLLTVEFVDGIEKQSEGYQNEPEEF